MKALLILAINKHKLLHTITTTTIIISCVICLQIHSKQAVTYIFSSNNCRKKRYYSQETSEHHSQLNNKVSDIILNEKENVPYKYFEGGIVSLKKAISTVTPRISCLTGHIFQLVVAITFSMSS